MSRRWAVRGTPARTRKAEACADARRQACTRQRSELGRDGTAFLRDLMVCDELSVMRSRRGRLAPCNVSVCLSWCMKVK